MTLCCSRACGCVCLQQRDSECGFIAIVLKTLVTQVKCELKDITQLEALRLEYLGLQMQLGHWLTDCPSVADLKAARQTIKALKSRLRHTLADKQDAEEVRGGEGQGNEKRVIKVGGDQSFDWRFESTCPIFNLSFARRSTRSVACKCDWGEREWCMGTFCDFRK